MPHTDSTGNGAVTSRAHGSDPRPPGPLTFVSDLSFGSRIIFGFALGIATGLFFGEGAALLQPAVDVYIRLMQMTVIPYLVLGLMASLGRLSRSDAKLLAEGGGLSIAVMWVATAAVIVAMTFTFPVYQSASFFSTAMIDTPNPVNLAELFVPDNPFNSLANSVVPAIVLFCVAMGLALIDTRGKERVIDAFLVLNEAVSRVTKFVTGLMPIGIFAIGAVAAGTLSVEEFERLQVYFGAFIVAALLLSFLIVPLFVTALTPFRYRDVVSVAKDALLTAFVADNLFIVLPILAERCKKLIRDYGLGNENADASVDAIIPIAYNFPMAGKLLMLLFVPFAAWLAGEPLEWQSYPLLFGAGALSFFAKTQTAIPFLLDLLDIPHDLFQLYLASDLLTGRFSSLLAAVCLLATSLIATGFMTGYARPGRRRLLRSLGGVTAATVASVLATQFAFAHWIDTNYRQDQLLKNMNLRDQPVETTVHEESLTKMANGQVPQSSALQRIRERGSLRVGYNADRVPLTFFNGHGDLVGFDVELAGSLALNLGVKLEFVPYTWEDVGGQIEAGLIDIVPSVPYNLAMSSRFTFSRPYYDGVLGFAVRDPDRAKFTSLDSIRRLPRLTIGSPLTVSFPSHAVERFFAPAEIELRPVPVLRDFFEGKHPEIDALLIVAEAGTAWTLLYPHFSVVVPKPTTIQLPMGFLLSPEHKDLLSFVEDWVVIHRAQGTIQRAYDYWILGQGASRKRHRWSVVRNVLGWVE